jgi:hypothetical protein
MELFCMEIILNAPKTMMARKIKTTRGASIILADNLRLLNTDIISAKPPFAIYRNTGRAENRNRPTCL